MNIPIKLRVGTIEKLARYTSMQLNNLFPYEGVDADVERIISLLPSVIDRICPIINAIRSFDSKLFDHINSLQYCTFLYLLANEYWQVYGSDEFADRLFCLNRTLNSIDLFYSVQMPTVFFISHGLGAVIGNAQYASHLVFFQNVTVGRVGEERPVIGENVVLYPGATITGSTIIGNNSVISAGCHIHGICVPENTLVTGTGANIELKPRKRNYINLYFY